MESLGGPSSTDGAQYDLTYAENTVVHSRGSRIRTSGRFTLIVSVVALVGGGCDPLGSNRRAAATYLATQRLELQSLARLQASFYSEDPDGDGVSEYASDLTELSSISEVTLSEGVTIRITEASELGWAAISTHAGLPESGCAIYFGDVTPPTTSGGTTPTQPLRVACD
jgi:hypothetical protein